jgi:Ni,Fe-hydrogenase III large subunit
MPRTISLPVLFNGQVIRQSDIPVLSWNAFSRTIIDGCRRGLRLVSLFGAAAENKNRLYAVLADDSNATLQALAVHVKNTFPSMTIECPQAHLFEREIFEQLRIEPVGHPWLKPVRFPGKKEESAQTIGAMEFFKVSGDTIHEVAVGPVHAGVIEPGHFRFQCHGEIVQHMEISLGYQHRGVEEHLLHGPNKKSLSLLETVAGDTSIGHATAYCMLLEALARVRISGHSQMIRAIALELERLANHIGDLGALAGDVGFLPTSAQCGAIRGDFLNMTALLCGSRLGRTLLVPGGVRHDLELERLQELKKRLDQGLEAVTTAVELMWDSTTVLSRFENTGVVKQQDAIALGLVGPAGRACGLARDVRQDHPSGIYQLFHIPVATAVNGDVHARAMVRWLEIQRSVTFIHELLQAMAPGALHVSVGELQPDSFVVSMVEGWRGEICHIALTDSKGCFQRYKIIDPSFHNWFGLAMALRDQAISDFPLCNKSFNLSYCGFDL